MSEIPVSPSIQTADIDVCLPFAPRASAVKFHEQTITDQKRFVRGEQYLFARGCLRARDGVHHRKWRVLMLAGGAPAGEISAIRELMPKAYIVAVDTDQRCLSAAIDAGADDVVHCDLSDFGTDQRGSGYQRREPPEALRRLGEFDIVNLDLCGPATETNRDLVRINSRLLTSKGVLMVTFSYGRDVIEVYRAALEAQNAKDVWVATMMREAGIPEMIMGRLAFMFTPSMLCERLRTVTLYRGPQMPMCSLLFSHARHSMISFLQVEPGDFELAVCYPESASLYDCPKDRIESLRRKFAALRAVITRKEREDGQQLLPVNQL